MKIFFDTEFIEGPQPKKCLGIKYGETKPTIDLISIGMVAEDGREYQALSKDFNLDHAWSNEWIRQNVLLPIYTSRISGDRRNYISFDKQTMRGIMDGFGKTNKQIAMEATAFSFGIDTGAWQSDFGDLVGFLKNYEPAEKPEFWAYFADYDWVVFCQLFGTMMNLPNGFPFFCMDLKNLMEFKGLTKEWKQAICPDPDGEHDALIDARWNKLLYEKISAEQ